MNFVSYARRKRIAAPLSSVRAFTERASNLSRWTQFFREVGPMQDGFHDVETPFGRARTRIVPQPKGPGLELKIETQIHGRLEVAVLELAPDESATDATFRLRFPEQWTVDRTEAQLLVVDLELDALERAVLDEIAGRRGEDQCVGLQRPAEVLS